MIEYWIQRADFSVSNRTAASASELVKVLRAHDWAREVALRRELESNNRESCPPGMGIHASGSRLLHFYFPRGETNVADVICEGATGTTHSVILEVEWEQTMTEFWQGGILPGRG